MHQPITYSPAYTLVPTYECFNQCTYCNFRVAPGQGTPLSLQEAEAQLLALQSSGVCEILVLSGEVHPHSPHRPAWFQHLYQVCELALAMGFLPHTNAGPLLYEEMVRLRQVNVSLGLMLEQLAPQLQQTVHRAAPSKTPALRLQQLEWAGSLHIPFTTGLLLGLGETPADRIATLQAIADVHRRWGHIQEVILQPYVPGQQETWGAAGFPLEQLPEVVAIARHLLPSDITLQVPPNLVQSPTILLACLQAGARDLGGLVPLDHVNPDYAHHSLSILTETLMAEGWVLHPRLPLYPQFDAGVPVALQPLVRQWRQRFGASYTDAIAQATGQTTGS